MCKFHYSFFFNPLDCGHNFYAGFLNWHRIKLYLNFEMFLIFLISHGKHL